jgi:hypothetical protein
MIKRLRLRAQKLVAILVIPLVFGARFAHAAETTMSGAELAERIRSAEPEENSEIHGTLITRHGKDVTRVPIVCRVALKGATWETEYKTSSAAAINAELLLIVHSINGPNQYLFAQAATPDGQLPKPSALPMANADTPFAGSAFSPEDLGLEFLHWPQQKRLPNQTRLTRACYVLESSNPGGRGIVRVTSFIDQESFGLLIAKAYDANGQIVKEFSLQGGSFKKVNGHWRLERMNIRDYKTDLRTELKFDINE